MYQLPSLFWVVVVPSGLVVVVVPSDQAVVTVPSGFVVVIELSGFVVVIEPSGFLIVVEPSGFRVVVQPIERLCICLFEKYNVRTNATYRNVCSHKTGQDELTTICFLTVKKWQKVNG